MNGENSGFVRCRSGEAKVRLRAQSAFAKATADEKRRAQRDNDLTNPILETNNSQLLRFILQQPVEEHIEIVMVILMKTVIDRLALAAGLYHTQVFQLAQVL